MNVVSDDPISVVIVDDHDLVREGLRSVLAGHDDIDVVGEAATAAQAVDVVIAADPRVVLLDLRLGEGDGSDVARELRGGDYDGTILVLSVHDSSRDLRTALAAGADGYLLKSVSGVQLADGIRKAAAGETVIGEEFVTKLLEDAVRGNGNGSDVTAREREVLELLAAGHTNRAIAEALQISTRTAQKHVENLFKKLGVHDRNAVVDEARLRGILR
jgi:DNA-binding NarL/FixJ family response regulator